MMRDKLRRVLINLHMNSPNQDRHRTLTERNVELLVVYQKSLLERASYKLYSTGTTSLRDAYATTSKSGQDDITKATIAYRQQAYKKRRRPNKQAVKKKKKRVQGLQQKNIERYVKERYANDNGTGHTITTPLEGTNIRVMMQNPRGVMKGNKNNGGKRDGHLDYTHLTQLRDLHVDILGLPETNLNWRNVHIRVQWERVVRRVWPRSRIFYSAIKSEDNNEVHRQGGV